MNTPLRLLLARHGETDWNRTGQYQGQRDIPLNETGQAQVQALAERLADEEIHAIHASDLARAAETARVIGARVGREPTLDATWREIDIGALTGIDFKTAPPHLRNVLHAVAHQEDPIAEGAETYDDIRRRMRDGFTRICEAHAGETVLVVGHGGTLKVLIADLIGLPQESIDRLSLRGNASLSEINFTHGRPQLVMINDTRHYR
ncbi:MAG: histidine phosphatase family protein [Planctomycetota bacterium]